MGASFGFVYTSTLEFLDAYSADWGFSMYDLGSNFIGAGVYLLQEKKFNSQLIRFKWSYSNSGLAEAAPNLLGSNSYESLLKDYNAQTYWASVGFIRINSSQERWICASLGYSIDGFIRARTPDIPGDLNPRSQYYLSLDIDWSKIPTKNKHLKKDKILNELKLIFPNSTVKNVKRKHAADPSGKSLTDSTYLYFNNKSGNAGVACYDWSSELDHFDNLKVFIDTSHFLNWLSRAH